MAASRHTASPWTGTGPQGAYTAIRVRWDDGWAVVVLDPAGDVLATAALAGHDRLEDVGRLLLRQHLPRNRWPVRLRIHGQPQQQHPDRDRPSSPTGRANVSGSAPPPHRPNGARRPA